MQIESESCNVKIPRSDLWKTSWILSSISLKLCIGLVNEIISIDRAKNSLSIDISYISMWVQVRVLEIEKPVEGVYVQCVTMCCSEGVTLKFFLENRR